MKRRFNVWLDDDIIQALRETAIADKTRVSEIARRAISLYLDLRKAGLLPAIEMMLQNKANAGNVAAGMPIINFGNINFVQTLIDKVNKIEELISAQTVNVVKIKLTHAEKIKLREALDMVIPIASGLAHKGPDEVATYAVTAHETISRMLRELVRVAEKIERRGITLDDIAKSQSPDADLATVAVKALRLLYTLRELAKTDRREKDKRMHLASTGIAIARELVNYAQRN